MDQASPFAPALAEYIHSQSFPIWAPRDILGYLVVYTGCRVHFWCVESLTNGLEDLLIQRPFSCGLYLPGSSVCYHILNA